MLTHSILLSSVHNTHYIYHDCVTLELLVARWTFLFTSKDVWFSVYSKIACYLFVVVFFLGCIYFSLYKMNIGKSGFLIVFISWFDLNSLIFSAIWIIWLGLIISSDYTSNIPTCGTVHCYKYILILCDHYSTTKDPSWNLNFKLRKILDQPSRN